MFFRSFVISALLVGASLAPAFARAPLILQSPTVSRTQIAFVYGGDIWTVSRAGGTARRIVTGFGLAGAPYFSPDGSSLAFSANYDGSTNVYTVPAYGGEPQRLTYDPGADIVTGWTPDGARITFTSGRDSATDATQEFEIAKDGGIPTMLPLPDAAAGSFSPDGSHYAYVPNNQWEPFWQGYRGGQTTPIWIANMADSSVVAIPRNNENDRFPMWIGNTVYFVSDRSGHYTLYAYDTSTRAVTQLVHNPRGFDIVSASSNDGAIVYSKFDSLHLYDPATHTDRAVNVTIADEMPDLRPHWIAAAAEISNAGISPTGVRAVFEAHGDILTVPAENGSIRNLTQTPGVEERDPAWSPDGKWIAYFSDAGGEYTLRLKDQRGLDPERVYLLEPRPSFYYSPVWSPDSKKIAYADKHGGLYYIDLSQEHPQAVKIAVQPYETFNTNSFQAVWSPDSRYIAYAKQLPNFLHAVNIYDTSEHRAYQVTDGMSDATTPAFDKSGKYLYFLSSTNTGFNAYGLDMESDERPTSNFVYAAVLQKSGGSPVSLRSDDEPVATSAKPATAPAAPKAKPAPPAIDFDQIDQRIVALPIPEGNYVDLQAATPGTIFLALAPVATVDELPPSYSVLRFDEASRKVVPFAQGVRDFQVAHDGKKMLLGRGLFTLQWAIVPTVQPVPAGTGTLATAGLEVYSIPREEWAQMYHETWRIERDWFYDPHYHGLDLAAAEKRFAAFLPGLASRSDFTYLTHEMISYLSVGHLWVYSGTAPKNDHVSVGMLGADYTVDHDRFRFAKIYSGENWNPTLHAPLTQPGVNVHVGDYLLAVNGKPIRADREVAAYFQETAGKQTTITVASNPEGTNARNVVVVPLASEHALRNLAWIEHNRRVVDRLSGGKLGYVYLPDTGYGGFTNFNRYFFAQVNKEGVILDERYNHGGQIADYVIDVLSRKARALIVGRDGSPYLDPPLAVFGPKVMLINQYAGSGGDAMPWLFKKAGLGPLVGVRTWGGLVGIGGYPPLMDGGGVMAPRVAIGGLHGHWEVEGHGITPNIEVQQDPKLVREGHDPQLEAAVATALRMLREHPLPHYAPPPYPNHHPVLPPQR
ncbi:MAG TPA: PDZ domain-containing protein [Candidatus Baltobacteraceae bacterium]|nr:PDZ domain-containing protein [Candidatus Baltobacteraceae bacterium]